MTYLFRFIMRATPRDPSGYYYPRWDIAQKITVTAANKQEAMEKAGAALGENNRRWPWAFQFDAINEACNRQSDHIAEVSKMVEALEACESALEPYNDVKPRDWKTDRENLRRAHESARAALSAHREQQEGDK